jgi:hypothetical protein
MADLEFLDAVADGRVGTTKFQRATGLSVWTFPAWFSFLAATCVIAGVALGFAT